MSTSEIILATASQYKRNLLLSTGLAFRAIASSVAERGIEGATPRDTAAARADAKAKALWRDQPRSIVIGADQVLEWQGQTFGKAHSPEEAEERLKMFQGSQHYLHSAYAIYAPQPDQGSPQVLGQVVTATMTMRNLSNDEIAAYVATNEWQGCCGCYQFENKGINLFAAVAGQDATIIGLPTLEILQDLRQLGCHVLS